MLVWFALACGRPAPPAENEPADTPAEPSPSGLERFAGSKVFTGRNATAAVVLLHGSEGGNTPWTAQFADVLAQRGLVTASFCWYGCEGLPAAVHEVPLDRTEAFLEWFAAGPAAGLPVTLYGGSRGAEQALLLATLLGDTDLVDGVAAHAGSDTIVAAYDPSTQDVVSGEGGFAAAWTWRGEPLYGERALPYGSGPPIRIEDYAGPVLLSHGADDPIWPADRSRRLAERRSGNPALQTDLRIWEGEGHILESSRNQAALRVAIVEFAQARAE